MARHWIDRLYWQLCELLYYRFAHYYDVVAWLVSFGQWRRWQQGVWELIEAHHVLELGYGTGALLVGGEQRGIQMVGIDLSPTMAMVAARRGNIARSDMKLVQGSGLELPFLDDTFPAVIATFPAGYILDPKTLGEVHRVLEDGGRFVALGLGVEIHVGILARLIPVFYSQPSEIRYTATRVAAAGFSTRWVRQRCGLFTVSVLVADKEA